MLDAATDPAAKIRAARQQFAELALGWHSVSARSAPRARSDAEAQIFNQMVVALAGLLPDGPGPRDDRHAPAMTEARLLAQGVMSGGRVPDSAPWRRESSVTGLGPGDRIAVTEEAFARLAGVCLDGMARRLAPA